MPSNPHALAHPLTHHIVRPALRRLPGLAVLLGSVAVSAQTHHFELPVGTSVSSADGALTLTATRIDDTRCNPGDACPEVERHAGRAWADIEARWANARYTFTLHAPGGLGLANAVNLGPWRLQVMDILPAGRSRVTDGGPRVRQVSLRAQRAQRISVGLDESIPLGPEGASLRVIAFEDRRCPADVRCVWAGDWHLILALTQADGRTNYHTLGTRAQDPGHALRWHDLTVQLCSAEPVRRNDAGPQPPLRFDFFIQPSPDTPLSPTDRSGASCVRPHP